MRPSERDDHASQESEECICTTAATAVEYGVFIALIAAVIIFAVMFLGRTTYQNFECPTTRTCGP